MNWQTLQLRQYLNIQYPTNYFRPLPYLCLWQQTPQEKHSLKA